MLRMLTDHWGMGPRLARLFVATYGGSIRAVYKALGNLVNNGDQFYPLRTTSALLDEGYIQNSGGNLATVSLNGFLS
eukprot:s12010_g1.t1